MGEISTLQNPLQSLLDLPPLEKAERGLEHTPREIGQQPDAWKTTYQRCLGLQKELKEKLHRAGIGLGNVLAPIVYLVGAGTSDYTGRALAPLMRKQWGCEVWPIPSTTMLTEFEEFHRPGRDYFWISISRSGDSPEGVALLERILERYPRIQHLVITCNQQGGMAQVCERNSDRALALILDDAVNDRGLAMTSSFTNMLLAGQCVANLERLPEHGEFVERLSELGARFLPLAADTAAAVAGLGCSRAWFVGSGTLQAVANESALKVVELSAGRVAAMSESALGLRHGPMSSVDGNTAFVAFLSSDARRRGYELDLLREIDRKRLARVRAVVTANEREDVAALADHCLSLNCGPDFPDEYRPALDVMLGQLLGLFASMGNGLRPDQPSPNGAITRVVSPIKIYS
jgi:tagatose-6-phosphate ketose/aldose isomerase